MTAFNDPPFIAATLVFLFFVFFYWGVYQYYQARKQHTRIVRKIQSSRKTTPQEKKWTETEFLASQAETEEDNSPAKFLSLVGERLQPGNEAEWRKRKMDLLRAGIRRPGGLSIFWGVKWLLPLLLAGVFLVAKPFYYSQLSGTQTLLLSLILAAAGFYGPDLWLKARISERKRRIQEGIPDALDLLLVCVEAGMSLDASIQRVAQEIRFHHKDLSDELVVTNLEVRAGKERKDALKNLALRVDLEDVRTLVTLLIQTDQLGTSISQGLRVYSDAFRTQRLHRAEEIAARLPVKMVFPLAIFILPSMFVVLLGPAMIQILRTLAEVTS